MTKQEEKIIKFSKMVHMGNAIWHKLSDTETIRDFTCDWGDLTEYQKELYIATVEIMLVRYRLEMSPIRWPWSIYYKYQGGF